MKLSTLLFAQIYLLQVKFSTEALTNYRFLNLTKHTSSDLTFDDDYYYYDDVDSSKSNNTFQYDYYNAKSLTTTTLAPATTTVDNYLYYDDYDNSDYYDYYDDYKVDPYTCPKKCKCIFNKIGDSMKKRESTGDSDYAYEYTDDYKDKDKYKIEVDCSKASLNTVVGLFDELFPLDQIVKLNISDNNFRVLRIAQVFEDIVNLEVLDVSGNPQLRSLSPRRFLKKFRRLKEIYLDNLPQIKCNTTIPNRLIRIDCRWFKSLIYLNKRNLTIQVNSSPGACDVKALTSSIVAMSKCLRSFNSDQNKQANTEPDNTALNSNKIDIKIEPELDQLLIEGDTLTLTCRFKKLPGNGKPPKQLRLQNYIFLQTKLNWFMIQKSTSMSLALKPTRMNSNEKFFVSIFQTSYKFEEEKIIESKLIIKRTSPVENSGKYFCSTENSNQMNLYGNLNTSYVDIQVVNKNSLVTPTITDITNNKPNKSQFNESAIYCPQLISQTYKGVITWPKTLSNTVAKEKCSISKSLAPGFATHRCTAEGTWINLLNLASCDFESNLTRSLQDLTYLINSRTEIALNSELTLDKLISSVVNMVDPFQINKYDILFIQRFLVAKMNVSRLDSLMSKTLRAQFVWLNDLLAKLSPIEINEARKLDMNVFNTYFSNTLMPVLTHSFMEESTKPNSQPLISSYVATKTLQHSPSNKKTTCILKRYSLTQQVYIDCSPDQPSSSTRHLATEISLERVKRKTMLMIFENSNVFGMLESNKTFTNLNTSSQLIDLTLNMDESTRGLCSQVFGMICSFSNKQKPNFSTSLNLTLEIKMPANYYTLLKQIERKIVNRNKEIREKILMTTANLTVNTLANSELIYRVEKLGNLVEEVTNPFDEIFKSDLNKPSLVLARGPLNYSNDVEISKLANDLNEIDLNDSAKIWKLRESLINKWYYTSNYEVVYSNLPVNPNQKSPSTESTWSPQPNNQLNCSLSSIEQLFNRRIPEFSNETEHTNTFQLFAKLKCQSILTNEPLQKVQFLSMRHRASLKNTKNQDNDGHLFQQVIQMIDEYARLFELDIKNKNNASLYNKFKSIVVTSYEFFSNRVVYFAAIISSFLLIISLISYFSLGERLQMPRSFRHIFANIWLAAFLLIIMFVFGVKQIHIAHLCFATAIVLHYLMLCLSLWYTLYFYSLFAKLYTLKDRNFDLLFTNGKPKKAEYKSMPKNGSVDKNEPKNTDDDDYDDEDEDDFVQKPVIYLYMIGWGLPLLLCSVIVSITKRNYLTVPFGACFPNNQAILIGSLLFPVCILLLVKIVFITLITITLKRIVNDLKNDADPVTKIENSDLLSEKLKLCQDWANKESPKLANQVITENKSNRNSTSSQPTSITDRDSDLSNNYSDQTSVMDAQHKPSVQLKFAICSYFFLAFICGLGCLLVNVHRFIDSNKAVDSNETEVYFIFNQTKLISQSDIRRLNLYEFYEKVCSYSLSICLILYSLGQMSFYLLSRDDVTNLTSSFTVTQTLNRMSYNFKFRFLRGNRPLKSLKSKIENNYSTSDNNIYSEPNEECHLRAQEPIKIDQIDFKTEQKQADLSPIMKADSILYEESNNPNPKINQDESLQKSISDVLFSSSTKATPSTVSIKSSNTMSESSGSMSEMKPTLAVEEESTSDSQAAESLKKIENENKAVEGKLNGKKSHVRQSSILSGSANQNVQVIYGGSVSNKVLDIKSDILNTEKPLTNQYSSLNNRRDVRNSSTKSTTSKRPCYVYVDHSYTEDKMQIHRLKKVIKTETTFTSSNSIPTSIAKLPDAETTDLQYFQKKNHKSTKIDDLLTKSCSNNTGVGAIGTLGNFESSLASQNTDETKLASSSTVTGTNTGSSESFMKFTNSNKSADDSTTSSISSSIMMSNNNLINDLNNFRENLEFNDHVSSHYDERTVYGQGFLGNVYTSSKEHQISEKIYQSLGSSRPQQHIDFKQVLRTNLLRHSDTDVKNETSV